MVVVIGLAAALAAATGLPGPDRGISPTAALTPAGQPPPAQVEAGGVDLRIVRVVAALDGRLVADDAVSGLAPGEVVRVQAAGFAPFERGEAEQCVVELGRRTACASPFPVQFDGSGRADLQLRLRADVSAGECREGQPACLLRLRGLESGRHGDVQTVFGPARGGRVTVSPATGITQGQAVAVAVEGFPPGAVATAVQCAWPGTYDAGRCTAPQAGSTFTVGAAGSGRTSVEAVTGPVGPGRARCGPRHPCAVTVVVGPGYLGAPPAAVAFSSGPGAGYPAGRVVPGLAVAAVLAGVAALLAWRTDWTKPSEAASPDLDAADLRADLDLDQLFGSDLELAERDPIPW